MSAPPPQEPSLPPVPSPPAPPPPVPPQPAPPPPPANQPAPETAPAPEPVPTPLPPAAFLHLPGTVGPGFLAALTGLYGERATRRLPRAGLAAPPNPANPPPANPSPALLHGPAPWHAWQGAALRPFTMLRHPVARVQALFRATSAEPAEMLARWGLQPGFSFDDFIGATQRGITEHVANGMCRMLAADAAFTTPGGPAFDAADAAPRLLEEAVATLARLPFGLAEQMPASLAALAAAWSIPYPLAAAELPEPMPGPEATPQAIARIAARNTLDIALYETARTLFAARATRLGFTADPASLFAPPSGAWVDIAEVPGRQGFHPVESHGVAWLDAETTPRLHFRAPPPAPQQQASQQQTGRQPWSLSLRLLSVAEGYPFHRMRLQLDGRPWRFTLEQQDGRWVTLKTEPVAADRRAHQLCLAVPYAVPVRALAPGSADLRRLSVGVAKLLFAA